MKHLIIIVFLFLSLDLTFAQDYSYFTENGKRFYLVDSILDRWSVQGFGEVTPMVKHQGGAYLTKDGLLLYQGIVVTPAQFDPEIGLMRAPRRVPMWFVFNLDNLKLISTGESYITKKFKPVSKATPEELHIIQSFFVKKGDGYYLR